MRLTWFQLHSEQQDALTDIIAADGAAAGGGSSQRLGSDPHLVLRELGHGRGMVVPGLIEQELHSGDDITEVSDPRRARVFV